VRLLFLALVWCSAAILKLVAPAIKDILVLGAYVGIDPALARVSYFALAIAELLVGIGIALPMTRILALRASFLLAGALGLGWLLLAPTHAVCGCLGRFAELTSLQRGLLIGSPLILSALLSHPRFRHGVEAHARD